MQVNILGIRGLPASHGGFESFAAKLAPYLQQRGHDILVYCQDDEDGAPAYREDDWHGIRRVFIAPRLAGAMATVEFDLACIRDVAQRPGVDLVLGYNTAVFSAWQRLKHRKIAMNMDGIEWKRDKWGGLAKAWFYLNEIAGSNLCTVAIADHPEIARHVERRTKKKAVVIPYGADLIDAAPLHPLEPMGLQPNGYYISIARIEPENSILEIVRAFSAAPRDAKLIVLGRLEDENGYHTAVRECASRDVIFPGAIYDPDVVSALRFHARAYVHGHTVGGTNPSLVEALGAGNAVIAHDNRFNRWVAGNKHRYFSDEAGLAELFASCEADSDWLEVARRQARKRHSEAFQWDDILARYETLLTELADGSEYQKPSSV